MTSRCAGVRKQAITLPAENALTRTRDTCKGPGLGSSLVKLCQNSNTVHTTDSIPHLSAMDEVKGRQRGARLKRLNLDPDQPASFRHESAPFTDDLQVPIHGRMICTKSILSIPIQRD